MSEKDELKNFWKDKEKVEKVEKSILEKEKKSNKILINNDTNQENHKKRLIKDDVEQKENYDKNINFNSHKHDEDIKEKSTLPLIIFIVLIIVAIIITYILINKIKEIKSQNNMTQVYMNGK
ncbi:MAG: hypothetical protein RBR65_01795 [Aliarcobacter sp.]|nr:hypothetical protein [Aliarcobacter sp.]